MLTYYRYDSTEPEKAIEKLKMRLSETTEFPHEIGLFLGYPVGDVVGFIKTRGKILSAVDVGKFIATSVKLSVDLNFSINVQEFIWNSGKPARAF